MPETFRQGSNLGMPLRSMGDYPVDSNMTASSKDVVLNQDGFFRFTGLLCFVKDQNKFYLFSKHVIGYDGSGNPIYSNGVTDEDFQPFEGGNITFDTMLIETSRNGVENRVIYAKFETKQDLLEIGVNLDNTVIQYSENPITSGAVWEALDALSGGTKFIGYFEDLDALDNFLLEYVPFEGNWCTIASDINHDGKKTKYMYDNLTGTLKFAGYVQEDAVMIEDDSIVSPDNTWSCKKLYDTFEEQHQPYQVGIDIIGGQNYVYKYSLYKAKADIPAANNIEWDISNYDLIVGVNGENVYVEDTTLYICKIITTTCEVRNGEVLVFLQD